MTEPEVNRSEALVVGESIRTHRSGPVTETPEPQRVGTPSEEAGPIVRSRLLDEAEENAAATAKAQDTKARKIARSAKPPTP